MRALALLACLALSLPAAARPFPPRLVLSTDTLDVGPVVEGTERTVALTLTNAGTDPLAISDVTVVPPSSGRATVRTTLAAQTLAPGASTTADVTFGAAVSDPFCGQSTLRFATNDPTRPLVRLTVRGQCLRDGPAVEVGSDVRFYGATADPARPPARALLPVLNRGSVAASVTSVTTSDPAFAAADLWTAPVPPGGRTFVPFTFRPTEVRPYTATAEVVTTAGTFTVALIGTVARDTTAAPRLRASATEIDFGTLPIGATATRTVRLANTGTAPLTLSDPERLWILFGNASASMDFTARTLAPGEAVDVAVTYQADTEWPVAGSGELLLRTTDPWLPIYRLAVRGTAQASSAGEPPPSEDALLGAVVAAPNPSRGAAALSVELRAPAHVGVRVWDAAGREVWAAAPVSRTAGTHLLALPADLAAGVYRVAVEAGTARVVTGWTVGR